MRKGVPHDPLVVGRMLDGLLQQSEEMLKNQFRDRFVLTGWKDVARVFGLKEVHTMQRWARVYKMPYMRMGGRITVPFITLIEWYWNLWELVFGEGGGDEHTRKMMKNLENVTSRRKKVNG
ncbi:MAG: hypothetical protein MUP27_08885 [Desulfobacterales bacterium]|nr:hypothetical protein [Desulfobacterales bacterium]